MEKIKIPPFLKKGDTIGIMCPAGYMPVERVEVCVTALTEWGFNVIVGNTVGLQHHYFAGSDEERRDELQSMLDDADMKAILFGRGGYGVSRIIDQIDFQYFTAHPKWLIGYSDITLLHTHLNRQLQIASLHSPMAGAFDDYGAGSVYIGALRKALTGEPYCYKATPHRYNVTGKTKGALVGGNLSLLAHGIGTPSQLQTAGKILFIEDVGEYIYAVDRLFLQLKRAGLLTGLRGLIIGSFSDMKDTTRPFGSDVYSAIKSHIEEISCPVVFDFPVGHTERNYPLFSGVEHTLTVSEDTVCLEVDLDA